MCYPDVSHSLVITVLGSEVITDRKQSLGQDDVFRRMCQSFSSKGVSDDVTSHLSAWSHVPSRGSLSRRSLSRGVLSQCEQMLYTDMGAFIEEHPQRCYKWSGS